MLKEQYKKTEKLFQISSHIPISQIFFDNFSILYLY